MSFSEETKQIMKHYLELYLKGTIIREEQDVLDAYVEEIKNSTDPEDIAFVSTYQGKVNKTRHKKRNTGGRKTKIILLFLCRWVIIKYVFKRFGGV